MAEVPVPRNEIRALHTDTTITVYQAYTPEIGLARVADVPIAIAGPDVVPDATAGTAKDNQYSCRPGGDARNHTDPDSHRPDI